MKINVDARLQRYGTQATYCPLKNTRLIIHNTSHFHQLGTKIIIVETFECEMSRFNYADACMC